MPHWFKCNKSYYKIVKQKFTKIIKNKQNITFTLSLISTPIALPVATETTSTMDKSKILYLTFEVYISIDQGETQ